MFLCTCPGNIESENGGWLKDVDKVDLAEQSLLNKLIRRSLVRNRNQVEVQQRDPTSPLFSVKTFEELRLWVSTVFKLISTKTLFLSIHTIFISLFHLINSHPDLLKGVYNMGFNRPSRIQENALPMMLAQP